MTIVHPEHVKAETVERQPITRTRAESLTLASGIGSDTPFEVLVLPEPEPEEPPAEQEPANDLRRWFDLLGLEVALVRRAIAATLLAGAALASTGAAPAEEQEMLRQFDRVLTAMAMQMLFPDSCPGEMPATVQVLQDLLATQENQSATRG